VTGAPGRSGDSRLRIDPIFEPLDHPPAAPPEELSRASALAMRAALDAALPIAFSGSAPAPDVVRDDASTRAEDGSTLSLRWYRRGRERPGSAVVFFHGGGLVGGTVQAYDAFVAQHVQWTGVPILSVEYRRAPDVRGETPARDGLTALQWLMSNAFRLGVDPRRIAVMGDSAGGGIAAGVAVLARDHGIRLRRQILIFPMLDDRTVDPDAALEGVTTWSYAENRLGWWALLGDRMGSERVTPVEAPARLRDARGLAAAYIEVGSLDIFRDEDVSYASALWRGGVDAELHVHPGAPHGYDSLALGSTFAHRWRADRTRILLEL
jgi:acetyl esterase/lipase